MSGWGQGGETAIPGTNGVCQGDLGRGGASWANGEERWGSVREEVSCLVVCEWVGMDRLSIVQILWILEQIMKFLIL